MEHRARTALLAALLLVGVACGSGIKPTRFTNPRFDFSFVERVAVLPFDNLSGDEEAGVRVTRLFITELLATGAVDVVEPGQVRAALGRIGGGSPPSDDQIVQLGKNLNVQAIVLGSVTQAEIVRIGAAQIPVVTLDAHMVETETGAAVWATTHTEQASRVGAKILGAGGAPLSETMRRCVRRVVKSLVR